MTREEAILWMRVLKHSKINWVGEKNEEEDIIKRCEEAEQEALDMAIEALQWQDKILTQIEDIVLKEHRERREK